jgi:hypothetical protein
MDRSDSSPTTSAADRGLLLIGGAIVAIVAVTVAVVLVLGQRGEPNLEPGSPEAALHAYLAAHENGDHELAYAAFSQDVTEAWSLEEYEEAVDAYGGFTGEAPSRRVLFDRADVDGDEARVHLTIEEFYGDGLSGDAYRTPRVVRMVREDGAWRIDEPLVGLEPAPTTFR